jgi:hypothetical protein
VSEFTTEEVVEDMLVSADQFVGGRLGICALEDEERAYQYLREKGWIGPKNGLTRAGVVEAKRAYREYWND